MIFKKTKTNKKALIYDIILVLIAFAALTSALIIINQKQDNLPKTIGAKSSEIINIYQYSEKLLYNLDRPAELSSEQSIINLNKLGGLKESTCGKFNNQNLWTIEKTKNKEAKCYPIENNDFTNLIRNLVSIYSGEFENLLDEKNFKLDNHEFEIKEIQTTTLDNKNNIKIKINGKAKKAKILDFQGNEISEQEQELEITYHDKYKFQWPVQSSIKNILDCYSYLSGFNDGLKIYAETNTAVVASAHGEIYYIKDDCTIEMCDLPLGNQIIIKHENNIFTKYTYLSQINTKIGDTVNEGEIIGLSGNTGNADQPMLGFYIYDKEEDTTKSRTGKSPLCYFTNERIESISINSEAKTCKNKYQDNIISKNNPNLARECKTLGFAEIKSINKDNNKQELKSYYSFKPSFSLIIDYNFNDYRNATRFTDLVLENCKNEYYIEECIQEQNKEIEESIEIGTCDKEITTIPEDFYEQRKINFCYRTNNGFALLDNPDIDFALYIPDNAPPPEITDKGVDIGIFSNGKEIGITWRNLDKNEKKILEIKEYHIYRNNIPFSNINEANLIQIINKNEYSYKDIPTLPGTYYYAIIGKDKHGNMLKEINPEILRSETVI